MAKQTAADLARKLVSKCPDAPARTLARDLHKKHPVIFPTLEVARNCVRNVVGTLGKASRKTPSPLHRKPRKPGQFCIPRGLNQSPPPIRLNTPGKWLVISDIHCPFHDRRALETALECGIKEGCKHVVINGDFYDNPRLSRWDRPPGTLDPQKDLHIGKGILKQIAAAFPGEKKYKIGNHDAWYELYIAQNIPELANCDHFRIAKFLELEELGYDMIASKQEYSLGKLSMYHGHELPKGLTDPVNVARGVFLRVTEAALVGHWHRTSHHVETSARKGKIVATYSVGCLCNLKPAYAPVNKWNSGFAIVDLAADGTYQVDNKIILKGKVY
jgi:predicted phosphodiesterase